MNVEYAVRLVQDRCPHLSPETIRARLEYSTFVNLDRRYMYVEVPKAGCTSIKTMIRNLEGLPPIDTSSGYFPEVTRSMVVHDRALFGMPSLFGFDDATQERVLTSQDFLRFAIVRNPYTRLESAWRDKVRLCAPGYERFYICLRGEVPERFTERNLISFAEFVAAISSENLAISDPHWQHQTELLFLPALNLNLIGHLENVDEVISCFLAWAGFPTSALPDLNRSSSNGSEYHQKLADTVFDLYEPDFRAFNYARDSWIPFRHQRPVEEARHAAALAERHAMIGQLYKQRDALVRN